MAESLPEVWLRGALPDVDPYLMPAAHGLMQVSEELEAAAGLTPEQLRARPGGVASVGFHLRHIVGSTDRLLTYARGEPLTREQLDTAAREADLEEPADTVRLVAAAREALERALAQIRATPREVLLQPRLVGRKRLPSTVLGLLFHVAEHAGRHVAQIVTTARMVREGE